MKTKNSRIKDARHLWNSTYLVPPNLEFFESTKLIGSTVRKAIVSEFRVNKYRDSLFKETVTLSRVMNDRKNKYRSDKGFRAVRKVCKVVKRIHHVDLKSAVVVIKSNLTETFIPSKQLCQWILIKMQSNALLLQLLIEYCTYAASKLHHRLRTGHNWIEVSMVLSMISRIWALSKFLLKNSVQSYNKLVSVVDIMTNSIQEAHWLSLKYKFPKNLQKWINLKY